jgi:predicted dehydrogenase
MPIPVTVGVVGTSWWADAMHLPALASHPLAKITAICGRNIDNARKMAQRWNIPHVYTDYEAMISSGEIQAIVVSTGNDTHYPITMKAVEAGLHVLCEKPIALTYAQARQMAEAADKKGIKNMVPFTYRYMPTARYIKELIDGGYIGRPYHLNLRYYTGYGRSGDYLWRFDTSKAGAGALGDIGSHFLYLASWFFGKITHITCQFGYMADRAPLDPEGKPYERAEDTAAMIVNFENGAQGVIHVTTLACEQTPFGQSHHMEFHGSGGTLYCLIDWDKVQQVKGTQPGQGMPKELPIPDHIWNGVRRDTVHNTYRDLFRTQDFMTREFITGIIEDKPLTPNFHDGAYIQRLIEAGVKSAHEGRRIEVESIGSK